MRLEFYNKGFISSGFLNFTAREAFDEVSRHGAMLVDVREEQFTGFKRFDLPAVKYIPFSCLEKRYNELPPDRPLIIADSVGLRSHEAVLFLLNKGYIRIANLAGGIVEWDKDGMPVRKDITEQLDGPCVCQLRPGHRKK